jgi:hypothetical protein
MKVSHRECRPAVVFLSGVLLFLPGCASSSKESAGAASSNRLGDTEASVRNHEDVKGKSATSFAQPMARVREAGLRALTFVGCEVKERHEYYLAGRRPNKFGLFVGSGGETVEIFLLPEGESTQVWVDTDLSFVGIAGQQGWNEQTLAEMTRILSQPAEAK